MVGLEPKVIRPRDGELMVPPFLTVALKALALEAKAANATSAMAAAKSSLSLLMCVCSCDRALRVRKADS